MASEPSIDIEVDRPLQEVIDGRPTFLVHDGEVDERALKKTRMDTADVMMAARAQHGLERLDQIKHAVLENDAGITIIPRPGT